MSGEQLRSSQIEVTSVTGALLRRLFSSEVTCAYLQRAVSEVLETILEELMPYTDQEFDELNGCRILPLADGTLGMLKIPDSVKLSETA